MRDVFDQPRKAYTTITSESREYGYFQKTCFHIHTPASYDYKLLSSWDPQTYKDKSDQDILELCYTRHVFPSTITLSNFNEELVRPCRDIKELLSFFLLANEIIDQKISMVIVADHHTIAGVEKLKYAIKLLHEFKQVTVYPVVILGIEISCADRNHVVGFFEQTNPIKKNITSWLEMHLFNENDGSFETSKEVLQFIKNEGGIGYIAHIDTSDTFKSSFLSGAYKQKLFEELNLVGVSNADKIGMIDLKIKNYSNNDIHYIIDNDAHDIDTLGQKCVWIKGQKRGFQTLKEAINDYNICVSFWNDISTKSYIEGLYIENSEQGYLHGKIASEPFYMNFSDELNCFIGGRGTGKSTVLELIEYVLSQHCSSHKKLSFLCLHGKTYVLYKYCGDEFLIELNPPIQGDKDDILRCFGQNLDDRYRYYYHYDSNEIKEYTLKHYIEVYRVYNNSENIIFSKQPDKKNLLKKFFDTRYSVNELVGTASNESINSFLYDILFENKILSSPEKVIRVRSISGLTKMLSEVQTELKKRIEDVNAVLIPFNAAQNNILRIIYTQNNNAPEPPIHKWLWSPRYSGKEYYCIGNVKYNLTLDNAEQYLLVLYSKLGVWSFLNLLLQKDVAKLHEVESIYKYCDHMSIRLVDSGVSEIGKTNINLIYNDIVNKLISPGSIRMILDYLKSYVNEIESFSLEFNINNRESTRQQKAQYRDVRCLSLGQKVVAMLSFILGYSDYSHDYRPLIIDQPEDNLDNQYIYKNLVKQLRDAKGKRQVIIATHSATLVTNTKSEQVCVMCSDGEHGWIDERGFTGETKIKKNIINYLEGGPESFKHKVFVYHDILEGTL